MASPTSQPTGDAPDGEQPEAPAESDVKRKFREALERKNAKHHSSAAAGEAGESKVGSAHGPQAHQKNFRRKSGG
jgi:hypothetical protein